MKGAAVALLLLLAGCAPLEDGQALTPCTIGWLGALVWVVAIAALALVALYWIYAHYHLDT